jgi:hypothetical protein
VKKEDPCYRPATVVSMFWASTPLLKKVLLRGNIRPEFAWPMVFAGLAE